jgi:hypothetical protein
MKPSSKWTADELVIAIGLPCFLFADYMGWLL